MTLHSKNKTWIHHVNIEFISEDACLLTWPEKICPNQHAVIMLCQEMITQTFKNELIDTVVAYNSLIIYYDYMLLPTAKLQLKLEKIISSLASEKLHKQESISIVAQPKVLEIPVYYGEDMAWDIESAAKTLKLSVDSLIQLHTQSTFQAYALGFTPGFCYLGTLPKTLHLPRKATPRTKIPAGAVAIAEQQTAIYPSESPGGWHIIGRTPIPLFQLSSTDFIPTLPVGTSVKFKQISKAEFLRLSQEHCNQKAILKEIIMKASFTILKLGGLISFQDLGRPKAQHLGFSASGASDENAFLSLNQLLGNNLSTPALEIIPLTEIALQVNASCTIAITGADCAASINEKSVPHWQQLWLQAGDVLHLHKASKGKVTYLGIKNGFEVKHWLGSASQNINETKVSNTNEVLTTGSEIRFSSRGIHSSGASNEVVINEKAISLAKTNTPKYDWTNFYEFKQNLAKITLRFIPSAFFLQLPLKEQNKLLQQSYQIHPQSNRMGYRLHSEKPILTIIKEKRLSKPVTLGTIQLPPDGNPIVLMKDRQTMGGYPVLGVIIKTDTFRLSQCYTQKRAVFSVTSLTFAQNQLSAFYERFKNRN